MQQKDNRMLLQKLTGIIRKSTLRHKFVKIVMHKNAALLISNSVIRFSRLLLKQPAMRCFFASR